MNPLTVVLIILAVFLLLGGLPPISAYHGYGYYPGGLGVLLIIVVVILLIR